MGVTLILIGVGCIIGAIIGGGVKLVQIELGPVPSLRRQVMLGVFGFILVVSGLIVNGTRNPFARSGSASVALPGKVDIFWCAGVAGEAANRDLAQRIAPALKATGVIGQIRSPALSRERNDQPDYQIFRDIVRFDPGERPAADEIARLATQASGVAFEAAPALPGTPSVNYLSVFVCAPR